MPIKAYEMQYVGDARISVLEISPIKFEAKYYNQYKDLYHSCFYEMRKALDLQPYNCCDFLDECLTQNIFLLVIDSELIGAVSISDNEIDDLIVNERYQRMGFGKHLLRFAVNRLLLENKKPILNVADWNKGAILLYKNNGFIVNRTYEC